MELLNKIKARQLQSRKERDEIATALLTTLLSEASMPGKNANRESTDEEVVAVIKKFIKNTNETLEALHLCSDGRVPVAIREKKILEEFLPSQLSEEQLVDIVSGYVVTLGEKNPKLMGQVMGMLKANYGGQYDGTVASKVVKAALI